MDLIWNKYSAHCNDTNQNHDLPFAEEIPGFPHATEVFLQYLVSRSPDAVPQALATIFVEMLNATMDECRDLDCLSPCFFTSGDCFHYFDTHIVHGGDASWCDNCAADIAASFD